MKLKTTEFVRRIALISDTHVGSKMAVFPENFTDSYGNQYLLSNGQKSLFDSWNRFLQVIDDFDCDTVFHLGDVIHGTNRKESGRLLMTSELNIQTQAAEVLLRPMIKQKRKFYMISGSGYHRSIDYETHEAVCKGIGGKFLGVIANIRLKGTNRLLNIAHGESGAWIYRTVTMDRESMFMKVSAAQGKIPEANVIARGHWHSFIHIHLPQVHLVQVPCWMAFEPTKIYLKSYGKMQPDIGGVILLVDKSNRFTIWHYLYPLPHISDIISSI